MPHYCICKESTKTEDKGIRYLWMYLLYWKHITDVYRIVLISPFSYTIIKYLLIWVYSNNTLKVFRYWISVKLEQVMFQTRSVRRYKFFTVVRQGTSAERQLETQKTERIPREMSKFISEGRAEGCWSWWVMSPTVADLQQPSCDDSPLYRFQMSLTTLLLLVTRFSSKLGTASVELWCLPLWNQNLPIIQIG